MECAIIFDSSHVTLALFSHVVCFLFFFISVYAVFLCRFYIHASEMVLFVYSQQRLSGEELCCSEMMQLFVIVLAMNEISLII